MTTEDDSLYFCCLDVSLAVVGYFEDRPHEPKHVAVGWVLFTLLSHLRERGLKSLPLRGTPSEN